MLTRGLGLAIVLLLLVTGGGWVLDSQPERLGAEAGTARVAKVAAYPAAALRRPRCHGLTRRDVRGADPTYSSRRLARFRNHKRMCRGLWLPKPRRHLVPQGIAVTGNTAWISGYRHRKGFGKRPCQLTRVDLSTGRRLAFHRAIYGQVGKRPRTYCRHGGGLLRRGRWLWVAEASKLWRVDPSRQGTDLEARRVWRIEAPVRGSAIVATDRSIGLVPFVTRGVARIHWYSFERLQRRGVLDLAVKSRGRHQLGAHRRTRIPRLVQGAMLDSRSRLFLARSNLGCGELVTPRGRRLGFIPGAEGIQLGPRERRLWTVGESGSRPYARLDKPFTPGVVSFEWPHLLRGRPAGCGFKVY